MPTKIGPFEILSELAKSPTGMVYKANDTDSGQTVALKAICLSAFGDGAQALEHALLEEADRTKVLSNPNLTSVYGAGEIDGQFCAAMEYVQGNSIATMLARKEGFSIWDLLDIGRQLCNALDHAASHHIVHYSLEPAKIMCGWDGTVKILGYGVSCVGNFLQHVTEGIPSSQHYMSPEQILEQPLDERSNLFSLGAVFYEMVTERKAFDRDDMASLRQSILDSTPVSPIHVNPKVHPLLSDLIMKTLEKDPAQRYQTGRELLDDLEKCKESKPAAKKPVQAAASASEKTKPAVQPRAAAPAVGKSVSAAPVQSSSRLAKPASATVEAPGPAKPATTPARPPEQKTEKKPEPAAAVPPAPVSARPSKLAMPASKLATPKAAAASAAAGNASAPFSAAPVSAAPPSSEEPELDLSNQFITSCVKATLSASEAPAAEMSAAVEEPQIETFERQNFEHESFNPHTSEPPSSQPASRIQVDPTMAGEASSGTGTSFSEITELPPLKEVYIAPPPPPSTPDVPQAAAAPAKFRNRKDEEKPKIQPREVAEKAIKEIKTVPPKLMLYALGGAGALILAIGIGVTYYIHTQNSDDDSGTSRAARVAEATAESASKPAAPAPRAENKQVEPAPEEIQPAAASSAKAKAPAPAARKKQVAPVAPVIVPGHLAVDSTPQGAQVQLDGKSDPSWVTPFTMSNVQPGQHTITVSKAGYTPETRTLNVTSGNQASIMSHLAQLMATLVVNSDPAGANIYVDGRDMATKTPAQISVDKGSHVVLVRKMGYIDETMNAQFVLGQTFNFSPTLRPLGNVDDIRTVGKMSRLLGGKGALPGQAIVSIHTQPKGAQVAVNEHILDKNSPVDVALDPGNYVIDITLTGYIRVHKIITVDRGGKVLVDEVLQKE